MNDDYDNYIIQKYRLAVCIAIIKNTPENSTPKKYFEHLINSLTPKMEPYDLDMTICEDDFNFNDDDDCIINENDKNDKAINNLNGNNEIQLFDSQKNDSITILIDFDFNDTMRKVNNDKNIAENNSVSDALRILKGDDHGEMTEIEKSSDLSNDDRFTHTQSTYYESLLQETNVLMNQNVEEIQDLNNTSNTSGAFKCKSYGMNDNVNHRKANIISTENETFYDSQRSITFPEYTDNFTHVSQSQVENIVLPRYFIEKERTADKNSNLPIVKQNLNINKQFEKNISNNKDILKQTHENTDVVIINNMKLINDTKKHKSATQVHNKDNIINKHFKNIDNNIISNTDAAYFNEIRNKCIYANDANSESKMNDTLITQVFRNTLGADNVNNDSIHHMTNKIESDINKIRQYPEINKRKCFDRAESRTTNELSNKASQISYARQIDPPLSQEFDFELSFNTEGDIQGTSKTTRQKTVVEKKEESEEEQIIEDLFDKLTDSQSEVVPFKVLEELNKVKSFLIKRNYRGNPECVSDSGYRSDSQSRSSFKCGLQSSNIWLNQSAYCLLSYLTQCPLVGNTEDITNEISKTLGRLIDRLHEEEKYPTFLEELLQTVDSLLKEIYEEESVDKLLEKDENIHRLFLLNKSSHIIRYTIEKIISVLEDTLTALTKEELLEIAETIRTENLAYIFHILETLIKKLVVYRNFSNQQSVQNSQEDEIVLKRSSITDIWRKKWNFVKKCDPDTVITKQCVLTRCREVLNKLIVQAMDGYSLISYFALQCFNLLQN